MKTLSRREFLRLTAIAGAGLAVSACAPQAVEPPSEEAAEEPEPAEPVADASGDPSSTLQQQKETVQTIAKVVTVIEAYAMEEGAYPEHLGGWIPFDTIAKAITSHPVLSTYEEYQPIPTQNAWHDSLLYWSDTSSYVLVSIGPNRSVDHDWIEDSEPSQPSDDIVASDGFFLYLPEGIEAP